MNCYFTPLLQEHIAVVYVSFIYFTIIIFGLSHVDICLLAADKGEKTVINLSLENKTIEKNEQVRRLGSKCKLLLLTVSKRFILANKKSTLLPRHKHSGGMRRKYINDH